MVKNELVNHVSLLTVSLFLITSVMFLLVPQQSVFAQINTTDNVTINISVLEIAEITVNPTNYTVTDAIPGYDTTPVNFSIKNTGSTNITNIFANVNTITVEATNPSGTGNPLLFAASGFLFIQNETYDTWAHAGRLEWNLSSLDSEYLNLSSVTANFSRGWYRNLTNTFLWKVENGTNGTCNATGTTFLIKEDPENSSSTLQRDFTSGLVTSGSFDEATDGWGLFSLNGTVLEKYCVATSTDCEKIFIYRYDKRPYTIEENFDGCTNSRYMRQAILYPGQTVPFYLLTSIPEGTPFGTTSVSNLVISAT